MEKIRLKCICNNDEYYVTVTSIVHNLNEAITTVYRNQICGIPFPNPFVIEENIKEKGYAEINANIPITTYIDDMLHHKDLFNEKEFWTVYKTIMNFFKTATKNKSRLANYLLDLQNAFAECKKYQYQQQKFKGKQQDAIRFYSCANTKMRRFLDNI